MAFLGLSIFSDLAAVAFLFFLCGFANGLTYPAIYVWRNEPIQSNIRASVLSIMSTFVSISAAVLMMAIGGTVGLRPMATIFLMVAFTLLSLLWLFTARRSQLSRSDTVIYANSDDVA